MQTPQRREHLSVEVSRRVQPVAPHPFTNFDAEIEPFG